MLLLSLVLQPLILEIEARCNLGLNPWYADNSVLIGRIEKVQRAFAILRDVGPGVNFSLNVEKTTA